jgi:phenylpropionate dioxygenase-like ring-hydroxylating dioxygenase large terminal subunit
MHGTGGQARLDDLVRGDRVHGRIYTDPGIFELEMKYIFEKSWLYVGHESQVPKVGDFLTVELARRPVVMARHEDGNIYVMYNRCGHRGAIVCSEETGNARRFCCCYHGWTFKTNGDLDAVPMRSGYAADFDFSKPEFGMVRLPRVALHRGFVFASMSVDGPDLKSFLGPTRFKIDEFVDAAPDGEVELAGGCHRYEFAANWKLQLENADDAYHPLATHQSTASARGRQFVRRIGDRTGFQVVGTDKQSPSKLLQALSVGGFPHGHTWIGSIMSETATRSGGVYEEYAALLRARWGEEKTRKLIDPDWHVMVIYPNFLIQPTARYIRVVIPVAVDRTIVQIYPMRLKGAPLAWNRSIIKYINLTHSAASLIQTDDVEAFNRCQDGLRARGAEWVHFSRGVGAEFADDLPDHAGGTRTDGGASELPMRLQYEAWAAYMAKVPESDWPPAMDA